MAGPLVVSLLTKQYAKLLGELEFADRPVMDTDGLAAFDEAVYRAASQKREIEEKLAAIETVIWMFDADWDPSAIRPNYPRKRHAKVGAISPAAYGILRDAKVPMTTRDIARVVAARLRYEKPEERDIARIDSAVNVALTKRVGVTVQIVSKNPIYWELIPRDRVRPRKVSSPTSRAA
jgi:hypothetical protein